MFLTKVTDKTMTQAFGSLSFTLTVVTDQMHQCKCFCQVNKKKASTLQFFFRNSVEHKTKYLTCALNTKMFWCYTYALVV